jgi:hypothetical protein
MSNKIFFSLVKHEPMLLSGQPTHEFRAHILYLPLVLLYSSIIWFVVLIFMIFFLDSLLFIQIGPLRCWPGGLCLSRSIGDQDVGEFIIPVPYVKQMKVHFLHITCVEK